MNKLKLLLIILFATLTSFSQSLVPPSECKVRAVLYPCSELEYAQALKLSTDSDFLKMGYRIEIHQICPDPGYPKTFALPKAEFFCDETNLKIGTVLGQSMISRYELSVYLGDAKLLLKNIKTYALNK